jgi:membrane-associated phospholipid phosphatase
VSEVRLGGRAALRRLAVGTGVAAGTTALARGRAVHPVEHQVFRTVNDLPHALLPPVFVVMQAGSFGAVFVAAEGLRRLRRPRLAVGVVASGTLAWLGCKVVKRWVGRGRPSAHLDEVTTRGPTERGLGFPSGHSAIAFTMAALTAPNVPARWRPLIWASATTVAWSRVYVGAHLPLDVVGGAALGLALGSATALAEATSRPGAPAGGQMNGDQTHSDRHRP